jgi:hypothetical protein
MSEKWWGCDGRIVCFERRCDEYDGLNNERWEKNVWMWCWKWWWIMKIRLIFLVPTTHPKPIDTPVSGWEPDPLPLIPLPLGHWQVGPAPHGSGSSQRANGRRAPSIWLSPEWSSARQRTRSVAASSWWPSSWGVVAPVWRHAQPVEPGPGGAKEPGEPASEETPEGVVSQDAGWKRSFSSPPVFFHAWRRGWQFLSHATEGRWRERKVPRRDPSPSPRSATPHNGSSGGAPPHWSTFSIPSLGVTCCWCVRDSMVTAAGLELDADALVARVGAVLHGSEHGWWPSCWQPRRRTLRGGAV